MKYRISELLAAKSITTAGTETLDINVTEPISRITVVVRLTNSSWTPTAHPALAITRLELVDGSDVLFSLRGMFAQAVSFYGTKVQPFSYCNFTDNGIANANVPIDFGRYLYDPELALTPSYFKNLQLKVTHNYLAGGAVPDAATLEVWADLFDENPPSPIGFLMSKSHWSKTPLAAATSYVDLPTDHPIRLVLPATFSDTEEPDINLDNLKITEDHDKRVLLEAGVLEILQMYESQYPIYHDYGEGKTVTNTDISFFFTPQKDLQLSAIHSEDSDGIIHAPWSGGGKRILDASAGATVQIHATGRCPHGVIPVPMGRLDVIDDWWDVTKLGSARIKLVEGAPGTVCTYFELLLQQLRRY
jgi:hypothetical protein